MATTPTPTETPETFWGFSSDEIQTYLGFAKAAIIAVIDVTLHAAQDAGFDFTSPTFWLGLLWAAVEAVKGRFSGGSTEATKKA